MSESPMMLLATNKVFGPPEVVLLETRERPKPSHNQILVKAHAASVSTGDVRLRSRRVPKGFGFIMGLLFGFSKPKYTALGTDLCGEVVDLGKGVTHFKVGDRVLANLGMNLGGHAQYKTLNQTSAVIKIPDNLPSEEAAAMVFGGTTALVFLRDKLNIKPGERILITGAGGAVGSAAVQLGVHFGAHVTGVCSNKKASTVASLGAQRVIDYELTDWLKENESYDVILDTVGANPYELLRQKLSPHGRLGLIVADLMMNLKSIWISTFSSQKIIAGAITESPKDLEYLVRLYQNHQFKPLIGATFPLDQIVAAHRMVDEGHKLGSVIIRF